jgi:uncharacterized protein (DUF1330 family)
MSAFFIANVKIKDQEKFQEYARKAGETFISHGGEPVLRGKVQSALTGSADHHAVGVVRFPSHAQMNAWYNSPEYQAIVPLRDEAAEMTITAYSMPA